MDTHLREETIEISPETNDIEGNFCSCEDCWSESWYEKQQTETLCSTSRSTPAHLMLYGQSFYYRQAVLR